MQFLNPVLEITAVKKWESGKWSPNGLHLEAGALHDGRKYT